MSALNAPLSRRTLFGNAGKVFAMSALVALPVAFLTAHDAIPPAWADYLNAHATYHTLNDPIADAGDCMPGRGDDGLYAEHLYPLGVRLDGATETILETCAQSPRSAGIKLRRAFIGLVPDAWAERLAMGRETAADLRSLDMSDLSVRMMWSAIGDVERMGAN